MRIVLSICLMAVVQCLTENGLCALFQKNVEELLQRKGGGLSQDGSMVCKNSFS